MRCCYRSMDSLLEATSTLNSGGLVAYPSSEMLDCPPLPGLDNQGGIGLQLTVVAEDGGGVISCARPRCGAPITRQPPQHQGMRCTVLRRSQDHRRLTAKNLMTSP